MQQANPYDKYLENTISTASKEELTLMLYDGALKFCNQAIAALEANDMEKTGVLIIKVQNIIREFQLTLDKKYEVANDLGLMYEYIHRQLVQANVKKDREILLEMQFLLRELRDTWKEAMALAKQQKK